MSIFFAVPKPPDSLHQWFSKVQQQNFAMLLDSAAPDHPNSCYDILVCQPKLTLTAYGAQCHIEHFHYDAQHRQISQRAAQQTADPFLLLKQLQQQYLPSIPVPASALAEITLPEMVLPFVGGVVGYFGYDLARTIEKLPQHAIADITIPDLAVGFYEWALVLDKQQHCLWYVDLHGNAATRWLSRQTLFVDVPPVAVTQFTLTSAWQANMTQAAYLAKFAQIQEYLLSGDCYQINLAQRFQASYIGDEWQAYLTLRQTNAAPFSAFIRLDTACILSISPERFIEVSGQQVSTKPIKGTKPRFADPQLDLQSAEALRHSGKDRAENVMIVDLLRNDLGKVCQPGTVKVPSLFAVESFPAVHHLVSTVVGTLANGIQAIDALKAAFPGGSITGAPKVRAMQIIEQLEPQRRSVYCGAIGYLSQHGHMDTNIAIRTLVCQQQQIYCWAGGGIVADSVGDSEYQETFDKVARILPVLSPITSG